MLLPELALARQEKHVISHISPDQVVQVKTLPAYGRQ